MGWSELASMKLMMAVVIVAIASFCLISLGKGLANPNDAAERQAKILVNGREVADARLFVSGSGHFLVSVPPRQYIIDPYSHGYALLLSNPYHIKGGHARSDSRPPFDFLAPGIEPYLGRNRLEFGDDFIRFEGASKETIQVQGTWETFHSYEKAEQ
jgi:hypothetical protein